MDFPLQDVQLIIAFLRQTTPVPQVKDVIKAVLHLIEWGTGFIPTPVAMTAEGPDSDEAFADQLETLIQEQQSNKKGGILISLIVSAAFALLQRLFFQGA